MLLDNREAAAYMLFRRFNCSRVEALAAVNELGSLSRAYEKWLSKQWRSRRRLTKRAETALSGPALREAAVGGVGKGKAQMQDPHSAKGDRKL